MRFSPQSFPHLTSDRNLLGLRERQFTFADGLETESEIHCNDPGGGAWFGRMAEQSPLTGYIKISSEYTRRSTFLHEETVSTQTSTTCPPELRLMIQTLWMRK